MIDEWPTAIEDVTNTFQNQQLPNIPPNTQIWIMMEVLCGIPEEVCIYSKLKCPYVYISSLNLVKCRYNLCVSTCS